MMKVLRLIFVGFWSLFKKTVSGLWNSSVQMFHSAELAVCLCLLIAAVVFSVTSSWQTWILGRLPVPYVCELIRGFACFVAFAAGFGFCYFNTQLIRKAADVEAAKKVADEAEKHALEVMRDDLKKKLDDATAKIAERDRTIAEQTESIRKLKSSRIDINAIEPILNLGVADVEMTVKEPFEKWMPASFVRSPLNLHRPKAKKFVGVLQKDFVTRLGVDLRRVKIRIDENNKTLFVTNVAPAPFPGDSPTKWLWAETLEYKLRSAKPTDQDSLEDKDGGKWVADESAIDDIKVRFGGDDLHQCKDAFAELLSKRIKETSFEGYGLAIRFAKAVAEKFLSVILSPCEKDGYRIDFSYEEKDVANWPHPCKELMDFAREYGAQAKQLDIAKTEV